MGNAGRLGRQSEVCEGPWPPRRTARARSPGGPRIPTDEEGGPSRNTGNQTTEARSPSSPVTPREAMCGLKDSGISRDDKWEETVQTRLKAQPAPQGPQLTKAQGCPVLDPKAKRAAGHGARSQVCECSWREPVR